MADCSKVVVTKYNNIIIIAYMYKPIHSFRNEYHCEPRRKKFYNNVTDPAHLNYCDLKNTVTLIRTILSGSKLLLKI